MTFLRLFLLSFWSSLVYAAPTSNLEVDSIVHGEGRWAFQNNSRGACGMIYKDSDYTTALNVKVYGKPHTVSHLCGKTLHVKSAFSRSIKVVIADLCYGNGCGSNPFNLVLSRAAFRRLSKDNFDLGVIQVHWSLGDEEVLQDYSAPLRPDLMPPATYQPTQDIVTTTALEQLPPQTEVVKAASTTETSSSIESTSAIISSTSLDTPKVVPEKPTKEATTSRVKSTSTWNPETATSTKAEVQVKPPKPVDQPADDTSDWITAKATYYFQEGRAGSCGYYAQDAEYVVAMSFAYFRYEWCGRKLLIEHGGKEITAVMRDKCEACVWTEHIDLSTGAFDALSPRAPGVIPIKWRWA